jgi:TetR/AcrR family transcriptional regulator, transcriptional repressor for nem operon
MPRPKSQTRNDIVAKAMVRFWHHGFEPTSMDDLVRVTGTNRHSIYAEFGGKRELFAACLASYAGCVVDPAFRQVEQPGAGLDAIAEFFETQIRRGEAAGLPGAGCLMANTMSEVAPHDPAIFEIVAQHNQRLHAGFVNALTSAGSKKKGRRAIERLDSFAALLVVFANGLWLASRTADDAATLRRPVREILHLIERSMSE